jgi:hypothetical protein
MPIGASAVTPQPVSFTSMAGATKLATPATSTPVRVYDVAPGTSTTAAPITPAALANGITTLAAPAAAPACNCIPWWVWLMVGTTVVSVPAAAVMASKFMKKKGRR